MCTVAIVVPVYKKTLTVQEVISYRQLLRILGAFEIIIVAPEYLDIPKEIDERKIRIVYFSRNYFESVDSYSKLMLSPFFYKQFIKYQYLLIYQLDAFVFKNELLHFCGLGCDYIGAPWISGFCEYSSLKRKVLYVGNGGLSLRRVEACIDALRCNGDLLEQYCGRNEDVFFAACDGRNFSVASLETALAFSFEREVKACYQANHEKLPFGCHAWERYDFKFWKKYIEEFGYMTDQVGVDGGEEDQDSDGEYLWMKRNAALMEKDDLFYGIPGKLSTLWGDMKGGPLYLWGAGYVGRYVNDLLQDLGITPDGFIDSSHAIQGEVIGGLMVCAPSEMKQKSRIIVTVEQKNYRGIIEDLERLKLTFLCNYILFEDILPEV